MGWERICTSKNPIVLYARLNFPDDVLGPRHIILREQSTEIHFIPRAPALRGPGASVVVQ